MRAMGISGAVVMAGCAAMAMAADRSIELERVVASERAFAARAQEVNARQAFVEFFAADAILYAPFPVPAFPRLREAPDWAVNIQWRPVAAAISGAGDMGYTTGPSEYRRAPSEPPVGHGHYTSVWQRQADGRYLVRIDIGIENPAPPLRVADWSAPARPPLNAVAVTPAQRAAALSALRELDARTGMAAQANARSAFEPVFAEDGRLHRGGRLPVVGRTQALADLGALDEAFAWSPEGAAVAESGDFGYVYGRGRTAGRTEAEPRDLVYLNIWQRRAAEWRLIVHVSHTVRPRPTQ